MAQRDYRAYAQTPQGKAARQRAHQRYIAKRRAQRQAPIDPNPLAQVLANWRTQ